MSTNPKCQEMELLASEVALGIASGDERAIVLAHARSCEDCRRVLEDLSVTADALLLLGPVREPTPGFENKVLAGMQSSATPRWRMAPRLAAVAAACVILTGAAAFWITADERETAGHYRDALAIADGEYFGVVPLRSSSGDRAGHLFAYQGDPAWVFLIFETGLEPGRYEAEIETASGEIRSLGGVDIDAGDVTWGRDIPVPLRELATVRIVDNAGAEILRATFAPR